MSLASSWGWGERVRAEQPRINLDEYVSGFANIGAALRAFCLREGWVGIKDKTGRDSDLHFEDVAKAIPQGIIQEIIVADKDTIRITRRNIIALVELAVKELKDVPRQDRPKRSRGVAIRVAKEFIRLSEGIVKGDKVNNKWVKILEGQNPETPLGDGEIDNWAETIDNRLVLYKDWVEGVDFSGKSLQRQ